MSGFKIFLSLGIGQILLAGCASPRWGVQEVRYSYAEPNRADEAFDSREVILLDRVNGETWILSTSGEGEDSAYVWRKVPREEAATSGLPHMHVVPRSPMAAMPNGPR